MPISRFFSSAKAADAAAAELKRSGYRRLDVVKADAKSGSEVTEADLRAKGVPAPRAAAYAARINKGASLVIVEAPFGKAAAATALLKHAGGSSAADKVTYESHTTDRAAPLSSAAGWPVLTHDPAPFSRFWNLPLLASPKGPESSFGLRTLSANAAPLSRALGCKTLDPRPAPFSAWLGRKVLSENATPLSAAFGWKTLLANPAPLSSLFGWRVLSGGR